MTDFTIILPHLRNPGNDAALRVCLDCLIANTRHPFNLLMAAVDGGSLQRTINRMVREAPTECVVYHCSDTFMAPDWDVDMLAKFNAQTFVTNIVVEPGVIGVHEQNVGSDFGHHPHTFERARFEAWAATAPMRDGEGWYAPYMFPRTPWLDAGGLNTASADLTDFAPVDIDLFEQWKAMGNRVVRAHSFCYHLQRYSDAGEQTAGKRRS